MCNQRLACAIGYKMFVKAQIYREMPIYRLFLHISAAVR